MAKEITTKRTENSKTYYLKGRTHGLDCSIGAIHYKDNYNDKNEQWKDIDLTWENNKITKAPYILELIDKKIEVTDKKTGEISTIELIETKPSNLKWDIVPENTRVSFRHFLPSDKIPFEAKFKIKGNIPLRTRAFDDEGELQLETSYENGVLTEKLNEIQNKKTGEKRELKGTIKIDPTLDLESEGEYNEVNRDRGTDGYFINSPSALDAGRTDAYGELRWHGVGIRFNDITISVNSTIVESYLTFTARQDEDDTVINTRIWAENKDNPSDFENDDGDSFDDRVADGTTAVVDWDDIGAWVEDNEYDSPDIKTVIQEIINRSGWNSGNSIVLFWNDYDERSSEKAWVIRSALGYISDATKAAKLYIEYEEPTSDFELYTMENGSLVSITEMYQMVSGSLEQITDIQF